jgi:hypothetical protein
MGFIGTSNIILNHDVNISDKCLMSYSTKISDIKNYKENYDIEIIKPTIMVCEHLKDKIGYCINIPLLWVIDNNELKTFYQPLNIYRFNSFSGLIKHLSDNRRKVFLNKIVKDLFSWKSYIIEIDNTPKIRESKLKEIRI